MRLIDAEALREKLIELNYQTRAENMNEACVRAVDYAPTIGGWISVQDRLPEERGRYLCWFGKNTLCVGADIATYLPEWHGFGILETDTVLQNITHWMPLPEPPEEVSRDADTGI